MNEGYDYAKNQHAFLIARHSVEIGWALALYSKHFFT